MVWAFLQPVRRCVDAEALQRVGLLCFGGIGDVLLFSPVIAAIRAALPEAHLALFVEERSLVARELLAGVDSFHPLPTHRLNHRQLGWFLLNELGKRHLDAVLSTGTSPWLPFILTASGIPYRVGYERAGFGNRWLSRIAPLNRHAYAADMHFSLATAFLRGMGVTPPGEETLPRRPIIALPTAAEQEHAESLLQPSAGFGVPPKTRVLIHPGVSLASVNKGIFKGWTASQWVQLILLLSAQNQVVLAGGPDDTALLADIHAGLPGELRNITSLAGQTRSLRDLAAVMSRVDCVVCVDSSPLHLAVGLQRPTVALFGPTDERKLTPPKSPWVWVVTVPDLPCRPCLWDKRQTNCEASTCLQWDVGTVHKAVAEQLQISQHWAAVTG